MLYEVITRVLLRLRELALRLDVRGLRLRCRGFGDAVQTWNQAAELARNVEEPGLRITSYNVCYTKLLRPKQQCQYLTPDNHLCIGVISRQPRCRERQPACTIPHAGAV